MTESVKDPQVWSDIPGSILLNFESNVAIHLAVALSTQLKNKHDKAVNGKNYMSKDVVVSHAKLSLGYQMIIDHLELCVKDSLYDEDLMRKWFNLCGVMPESERYTFIHEIITCCYEMFDWMSTKYQQEHPDKNLQTSHSHGMIMGFLGAAQSISWEAIGTADYLSI